MKSTTSFRIIQLIDSLEAGGAERMAVNYANALSSTVDFSALVATRAEGSLKDAISKNVSYLFLRKNKAVDFAAVRRLNNYVKQNNIGVIHAHSTSIYLAVLVKKLSPKLVIVWHDHYGNSEYLDNRPSKLLRFFIRFCDGAIAVNANLKKFIQNTLHFQDVIYLPNFAALDSNKSETVLKGIDNFRIVCLANLREQKNHILLLDVASKLRQTHPKWTFHFVGKDFNDECSSKIKKRILELKLEEVVFLYGSCPDSAQIVANCDIAVLSSKSEGLPVAILEYGLLSKPVLATAVGEISAIIKDGENGYLAASENENEFYTKLVCLIEDQNRFKLGMQLNKDVAASYGEQHTIETYLKWLKKL